MPRVKREEGKERFSENEKRKKNRNPSIHSLSHTLYFFHSGSKVKLVQMLQQMQEKQMQLPNEMID